MEELPVVAMNKSEFWADPHTPLAKAREISPVAWTPDHHRIVINHSLGDAVLREPRMTSTGITLLTAVGITEGPLYDWWNVVMFNNNPPEHSRLRKLVSKAFTPNAIEDMRPRVGEIFDSLIAAQKPGKSFDFAAEIAHKLPNTIICEMLGVPKDRQDAFGDYTGELGLVFSVVMPKKLRDRCEAAAVGLRDMVHELLEERKAEPKDDLLTALLKAEDEGDRLTSEELVAMVMNLLFAGHDTTRSLLAFGAWLLLKNPDQLELLRTSPELIPSACEEILRFEPSVFGSLRLPSEDVEIEGVIFPEGEPVHVSLLAACRDPDRWDEPDRFDITRDVQRHLGFGAGTHFCLGAALARMEGQEVFSRMTKINWSSLSGPEPQFEPFASIRRIDKLIVTMSE